MKINYLNIIGSTFIAVVFLFLAYGSDESSNNQIKSSSTDKIKQDEIKCRRCGGSGKISTYSALGCRDATHFPYSECGSDSHASNCISSGSKTCPCCKGTGK